MTHIRSVLITGANGGLGKESARQIALRDDIEKIYLAVRNEEKGQVAKRDLESATGRSVFEVSVMDVTDLPSVSAAVAALSDRG